MHHPMSGRDQLVALKSGFKPAQQRGQRVFMAGGLRQALIDQRRAGGIFRREMDGVADALALTFTNETLLGRSFISREQREFDAR